MFRFCIVFRLIVILITNEESKMSKKTKSLNNEMSKYYKLIKKMEEERISLLRKKILEVLEDPSELEEIKKVVFDKKTEQFSIKIPKSLAVKAGLKEDSEVSVILNLKKDDTLEKIKQSKLVIYFRDGKDGKENKSK